MKKAENLADKIEKFSKHKETKERLSWNMPLFGAIMIMPNYKKQ